MTQRQRRYWRAFNKISNYTAVLDAVKGPKIDIDLSNFKPNYVEGITLYLEDKAHEMYVLLKSLGAIKTANDIKDFSDTGSLDINNLISNAKAEIKALKHDNEVKGGINYDS